MPEQILITHQLAGRVSHTHLPLTQTETPAIDEREFKDSMASLTFSIAVVTARSGEEEIGRTITSFMPLSATPPRVMISIDVRSRLIDLVGSSGTFSISFLSAGHEAVGDAFAGKSSHIDRFDISEWDCWPSGNRKLMNAALAIDCELTASIDAADHMLFVGTIIEADRDLSAASLMWGKRSYLTIPSQ